ncbi:MAG: phosphoribosyl-AMP cyclohydrolase [Nitriliruptor sp.]
MPDLSTVVFDDRGLVPAVVQQHDTGEVLMVAWMDRASLDRTLEVGESVFWSRSRQEQWHKGATSGDTQRVVEIRVDCDGDTLLVLVDQHGRGACHTGERSCFGRHLATPASPAPTPPAPPLWPHRGPGDEAPTEERTP